MTRHRASWPRSPPIAIVSWPDAPAWPSPGSWVIASALQHAGLDIATAVRQDVAIEFAAHAAYIALYRHLPDLARILRGAADVAFPTEPAARYATVVGPTARAADAQAGYSAFRWLARTADDLIARKVSGPDKFVLEEADVMLHEREYDRLQRGLAEAHHASALPDVPSAKPALNDLLVRLHLQQSGVMSHP